MTALIAAPLMAQPTFEVAAIRPWQQTSEERAGVLGIPIITGDRVAIKGATLGGLIAIAFGVKAIQVSGSAALAQSRFTVEAKIPPGVSTAQLPALLRTLLEERFHLRTRVEQEDVLGYTLTVLPTGLKAEKSQSGVPSPERQINSTSTSGNRETITLARGTLIRTRTADGFRMDWDRINFSELAETLSPYVRAFVVDQTGIMGDFRIGFDYPFSATDVEGAISDSLRALGLRLEKKRIPIARIVVEASDSVPTEN